MAIKYLNKPFFLASLICIFVFYSGLFVIPDRLSFNSLLNKKDITVLSGILQSSPVKSSSGKYYSAKLQTQWVQDKNCRQSGSFGHTKVYIPSNLIEAYFPGKLYSAASSKGAYLYEAGGFYSFTGSFNENGFFVKECTESKWPENTFGKIDYFRALCRLQFKRLMFSWGYAGGLLLALLSGAREYTDPEVSGYFRNSGLSHILALSGMHLSMFSSIAVYIGNKINNKRTTYLLRIIILLLFVWFAGFSPSLLRAFICSVLSLVATMNGTDDPDMLLILSFSFLLQCSISPDDIKNTGFMLSYGALLGILLTNRFFNRYFSKLMPFSIAGSLSASTGAQMITAPISLKIFGSFCPIGIIATTIVSPLVTIFIYSGLILIILSLIFPVLQQPSGIFVNLQYTVIRFLVKIFSLVPKWSLS